MKKILRITRTIVYEKNISSYIYKTDDFNSTDEEILDVEERCSNEDGRYFLRLEKQKNIVDEEVEFQIMNLKE